MKRFDELLPPSWKSVLSEELKSDYIKRLVGFVHEESKSHSIYPAESDIFRAFDRTPFEGVKVVVVGQDPYHGPGQANGLCFSVPDGMRIPPSLRNIFAEIERDLGKKPVVSGDLSPWAAQGVFLLNTTLTVRAGEAGSHRAQGWERFTNAVVQKLNESRVGLVFMLWGKAAAEKGEMIDRDRHLVLTSAHPSPLSAYRGFKGNGHFGKANEYLKKNGRKPIDW